MTRETYKIDPTVNISVITVPKPTYDAVADKMGTDFAISYLWGARQEGMKLIPRTQTAWRRLKETFEVRKLLTSLRIVLIEPQPFGSPGGSQMTVLMKSGESW